MTRTHLELGRLKPIKTHYPFNPKPSFNPKRDVKKILQSQVMKFAFACFVAVQVTWMSFVFVTRE
jgi:hypothetical protein